MLGLLTSRGVCSHHFAGLKPAKESGLYQMGGAILNSVPKDDEPSSLDMAGSTIVIVAESKAEVIEVLKKDIYATSGVWDVDNACTPQNSCSRQVADLHRYKQAQMWPLKCAFRIELNP